MTEIVGVDVLAVRLPFRFSFGHALAERHASTNVVVRMLGLDPRAGGDEVTEEELRDMVSTHGELDAANALAETLRTERRWNVTIPKHGETVVLEQTP